MDVAGGVCNLKAYDIIRKIEKDSKDPHHDYKQDSTVIPHKWKVWAASTQMNNYCQKNLTYETLSHQAWRMLRV